jgi:hypothetical protein
MLRAKASKLKHQVLKAEDGIASHGNARSGWLEI